MAHHTASGVGRSSRRAGTVLAGVVASGAVAVAAGLGSAPTANATCASFFGLNNSAGCTSSPTTVAIAIGNGATAYATGIFTSAFALGTNAQALAYADGFQGFSFASAIGNKSQAFAFGDLGLAEAVGANSLSFAGSLNNTPNIGNVALSLGSYAANVSRGSTTGGIANLAVNIGANTDYTTAYGTLNVGVNVLGDNNLVYAEDGTTPGDTKASLAFSIFGKNNVVGAGPGPFAIAGSILQTNAGIFKSGPGIAINKLRIGGAAAVHPAASRVIKPAAAATTAKAAAASSGHSKR